MRHRFADIELDVAAYVLRRGDRELPLQPKVFDVLRYLIEHRDRVVSKEELLDALWPGEHVNDSAVPWSISHVRNALGQQRGQKHPIETIHGRGYRFTAEVETLEAPPSAASQRPEAPRPASALTTPPRPFVGRDALMQRLQAHLEQARAGQGGLCLLCGEAGIGKTRCAEELIAYAREAGVQAWIGRASEGSGAPVFWPFIQILREMLHERPELHEVGDPLMTRLLALEPHNPAGDEEGDERVHADRFWLLDAITRLMLEATRASPALLVLDDLQWADAGSVNLLGFLAPELPRSGLLVVATDRDESSDRAARRLARLMRHAERFDLARLTTGDVGRYIAEVTASGDPPEQLSAAVQRASAGNPLFLQETLRVLIAEHGASGLGTLAATAIKTPDVARDVLRLRLQSIDEGARALLAQASVLGESFDLSLLQSVSGEPLADLLDMVEAATRNGLLEAETPERYAFPHALQRSVLYDALPTAERVALHRRTAEALEALHPVEPRHSEIAHHYYRSLPAGGYDRITAAAQRAAAAAEAVFAYEDAVTFYEWALEAQAFDPSARPHERAVLLLRCANAQRLAGRDRPARETLLRTLELSRLHGFGDVLVRVARVLRPTFAMSSVPDPALRDALEDVLRITPEGPSHERVSALALLACMPPYADDMQKSKDFSGRALELARTLGERSSLFEALRARLYSLSGPDDIDALLKVTDELLELERGRASWYTAEAYSARVAALLHRGDMAGADAALAAFGQTAQRLRLPEAVWYHDRLKAQRHLLDGDFAVAESMAAELRARSARMGLSYGPSFIDVQQTRLSADRHGLAALAAGWDFSLMLAAVAGTRPNMRAQLARSAVLAGQTEVARTVLEAFDAQGFERIPKEIAYLNTLSCLARVAARLGDRPRSERLYALLSPYPGHNTPDAMLLYDGSVSLYLGLLAACLGWEEQAEQHFEAALEMNERIGQRPYLARARYEYARWLEQLGEQAALDRSRELARAASQTAEELGMVWLVEAARPLCAG